MVRHIVAWNFRPEVTEEKKAELYAFFSEQFPKLKGIIPGVTYVKVGAPPFSSSTRDLSLYVEMEDESVIPVYRDHPEHVAIAKVVRANCQDRCCIDMEA